MWTLREAASAVGGHPPDQDAPFNGVVTDSRADCSGKLFVALSGERFDGHDYVAAAADAGAVAAIVSAALPVPIPQWIVSDPIETLGHLAAAWRARCTGQVIAITGSNGKTTTKEMIAAICRQMGPTRATAGNLNNAIGLPLTLLGARDEAFLVLEMGANHPGEIAYLSGIGAPDVAVITNAGRAHLEGFGSLEGVARAKGEIASGLRPMGAFIFMVNSPWTPLWRNLAGSHPSITFGDGADAKVKLVADSISTRWDANGFRTQFAAALPIVSDPVEFSIRLAGRHNVDNALAAASVAVALGFPLEAIMRGFDSLEPVRRRMEPRRTVDGVRLIDDTYNANPDSLAAAVAVLMDCPGRHLLVLGDFGELGSDAADLHAEMGRNALQAGVDRVFTLGDLSKRAAGPFDDRGRAFSSKESLIRGLRGDLRRDDVLLVKGSRMAAMDQVADALCAGTEVG